MENFRIANPVNLIIINKNSKILLLKRSISDEAFGGYWCIPGGGCEIDETFEEALVREIKEEINCKIIKKEYFKSFYFKYKDNLHVRAIYFYGNVEGEIKLDNESSEFQWYSFDNILLESFELAFNQKEVLKEFISLFKNNKIKLFN